MGALRASGQRIQRPPTCSEGAESSTEYQISVIKGREQFLS